MRLASIALLLASAAGAAAAAAGAGGQGKEPLFLIKLATERVVLPLKLRL